MYNILELKSDLAAVLHGTTINQVVNVDGLINRAARKLLLDIDPQETIRISPFANPIFDQVFNYAVPSDLKGNRVIDILPQTNRQMNDVYTQQYNQYFDIVKNWWLQNMFTLNWNAMSKTIRVDSINLPSGVTLNAVDGVTSNGTWVATATASGLTTDNIIFASGAASVAFNLAITGPTGSIANATMAANDLTSYLNQGTLFVWTYLPTASAFTSIRLRWGSSATAYYEQSATLQADGTAFQNGWNLLSFPWSTATTTGVPNVAAINYLQVQWTYSGAAQTGVHLNNIVCRMGSILNIEYYSKYLFRDAVTGAFQETVTDDSNLINLDTETFNLLFNGVAFLAMQQLQGLDAMFYDGNFFGQQYLEGVQLYKNKYKSQVQTPQSVYYVPTKPGWAKYINRRFR